MSDDDDNGDLKVVEIKLPLTDSQLDIEQMRKSMPGMMEGNKMLAKVLRSKYDALLGEGFTKQEALELCKTLEW